MGTRSAGEWWAYPRGLNVRMRFLARALVLSLLLAGCAGKAETVRVDLRPVVTGVKITGAKQLKPAVLRTVLAQRATHPMHFSVLLTPFFPAHHLEGLTWLDDQTRIANVYARNGLFDARVVSSQVLPARGLSGKERLPDGEIKFRRIVHAVEEGPVSTVRRVTVYLHGGQPGDKVALADSVGADVLAALETELDPWSLGIDKDKRFSMDAVESAARTVRRRLAKRAFARPKVEYRVDAYPEEQVVDVRIDAWPGRQAVFGPTTVKGLTNVKEKYIFRRIDWEEGDPWDGSKVAQTQQELYGLALFGLVVVDIDSNAEIVVRDDGVEVLPVSVTLRENKAGTLTHGPGIGFERDRVDGHYKLKVQHRNLFRLLVRGDLDLQAGYKFLGPEDHFPTATLETELSWPDFPTRRLKLFGGFDIELDVEQGYKFWSPEFELGINWSPLAKLSITASYSLGYFDLFLQSDEVLRLQEEGTFASDTAFEDGYFLSRLRQDIVLDLRDNRLAAGQGMFARITADEAGGPLQGRFRYLKLTGDVRGYVPLGTERVVLAGRVWASWIHTWGDETDVPVNEAVFTGGDGSVRGWKTKHLGPRAEQDPCEQRDCVLPLGGKLGLTGSLELRGNVWGPLWLAGFADAGRTWASPSDLAAPSEIITKLQPSVGGGIRFETPIGRLRLDVGFHPAAWTDEVFKEPYYRKVDRVRVGGQGLGRNSVQYSSFAPVEPPLWNIHIGIGEAF